MIDSTLHPLFDHDPTFMVVDAILHGLVEQNLPETALKFTRYTLPNIIKETAHAHEPRSQKKHRKE